MDLIERQAAIDALESIGSLDTEADKKYARSVFEALPSVQPKRTEKRTETHSCDLISRAMLLEYIHNEPVGKMLCDKYNLDGVIKQLPSAQPEIKPIGYQECADAMLKMWIDNVVTDGEYSRIMDKLNSYWRKTDG